MENYGNTLRILRKNKGFTLKSLSENIVSYSFLAKYEKGESDITLTNLTQLLERMNVSIEEFIYYNDNELPRHVQLLQKIAVAYSKDDLQQLIEYYKQEKEKYYQKNHLFHKLNYIMIGAIIQDIDPSFEITQKDISTFVDYIFGCSYWSNYEISLLGNALHLFNYESLRLMLEEVKTKINATNITQKNLKDLFSLLLNACLIFLRKNYIEEAKELSEFIGNQLQPIQYYEKTRKLFIDGLISIYENNTSEGTVMANQAIEIISIMDGDVANSFQVEFDRVLNDVTSTLDKR